MKPCDFSYDKLQFSPVVPSSAPSLLSWSSKHPRHLARNSASTTKPGMLGIPMGFFSHGFGRQEQQLDVRSKWKHGHQNNRNGSNTMQRCSQGEDFCISKAHVDRSLVAAVKNFETAWFLHENDQSICGSSRFLDFQFMPMYLSETKQ